MHGIVMHDMSVHDVGVQDVAVHDVDVNDVGVPGVSVHKPWNYWSGKYLMLILGGKRQFFLLYIAE
jgi:hypothetical protein